MINVTTQRRPTTGRDTMLITGGSGKLGSALRAVFPQALSPEREQLELQNDDSVYNYMQTNQPAVIVHAAAMTDVRLAQHQHATCWEINVRGTERLVDNLLRVCDNPFFVYVSTACVFDGQRGNYNEDDVPDPKNYYAMTKLVGEYIAKRVPRHLIIRTNFVSRDPWPYPRAFIDRFGSYLFADDVAHEIGKYVRANQTGLVHVAGDQRMSMYALARLTSPDVGQMTMDEVDIPLTVDMTLTSIRVPTIAIGSAVRS
ncbi:MAG: sugar nucleotide-binding protein [Pirellulaceae bacterium]